MLPIKELPWPEDLMTTTEVSEILHCQRSVLFKLINEHEIKRITVGNISLFDRVAQARIREVYMRYRSRKRQSRSKRTKAA